jgi:hypothetical protein
VVRKLKTALVTTVAASVVATCGVLYVVGEKTASAEQPEVEEPRQADVQQLDLEPPTDEELAARADEIRQEEGVREVTAEEQAEAEETVAASKQRRVRQWVWESPAETRARVWNLPEEESDESAATGLLRICLSEADGSYNDCVAIWQVLRNIRSRSCDRRRVRRITECDDEGETMLSVMRRAQKSVMGMSRARSVRTRWIREVTLACEQPPSWPHSERMWERQYGRSCGETATLAQRLIAGDNVEHVIRGVRPITWGGRCESGRGACDDPLACARGLARIPDTDTLNAFWCRPGAPGCSPTIDPICNSFIRPQDDDEVAQREEPDTEVEDS